MFILQFHVFNIYNFSDINTYHNNIHKFILSCYTNDLIVRKIIASFLRK